MLLGYGFGVEGLSLLGLFLRVRQARPNLNMTFFLKPFPHPSSETLKNCSLPPLTFFDMYHFSFFSFVLYKSVKISIP